MLCPCVGVCSGSHSVPSSMGLVFQWLWGERSVAWGVRQHMEGHFPGVWLHSCCQWFKANVKHFNQLSSFAGLVEFCCICEKSNIKSFVAPEEAAFNQINCLQWCLSVMHSFNTVVGLYGQFNNTWSKAKMSSFLFLYSSSKPDVYPTHNAA